MKEIEKLSGNQGEALQTVEVPTDVDFVYILRKDSEFVASHIAEHIAQDSVLPKEQIQSDVYHAYEDFTAHLGDVILTAFAPKGNVEIHCFDAEPLKQAEFKKAGIFPIVSLDPLIEQGVTSFQVSRGFHLGGIKDFGQIARPGSESLEIQAKQIAEKFGNCPVSVVEDDIFSGGSVISALEHLQNAGVHIAKLIPGLQIGKPTKLDAMGIVTDPVVAYKTADHTDIFAKVDLGDPRDYLIGASGLVVQLTDASFGRVPYLLPFVSTSARAGIPKENEVSFAQKIYAYTMDFFTQVEGKIGQPVLLKHMDLYFCAYMQKEEGVSGETPMTEVVSWAIDQLHVYDK